MIARIADGSFDAWADTASRVGFCAKPVRLVGGSVTVEATTGRVLDTFSSDSAPLGVVYRPCGNRRADVCPACSRTYARDTFEMLRAGLVGGKSVPSAVARNPVLFATLTAPSFGPVHGPRPAAGGTTGGRCRPRDSAQTCPHGRSTVCMAIHEPKDALSGAPLCDDCYDWEGAVVWNWWAPELWRRTIIALRRGIAVALGVPDDALNESASLQYAKVAEFQSRGLVHFHALLRLDGPAGAGSPAPVDGYELAQILQRIVPSVDFPAPPVDAADVHRRSQWGAQVDVKIIRSAEVVDYQNDSLKPEQVAGYLAKYATKDVASRGAGSSRPPHLRRLERICHHLASRAVAVEDASPYALLGKRTQTLGFRGHFSTKSRQYSVTLGALRRARHRFQLLKAELDRTGKPFDQRALADRLLDEDDDSTLIVGSWTFQGSGWTSRGDTALALAAAVRAREYAQWRAEQRQNGAHQREVRP
ncbi:MAG: replication initiator [Mycobacterium sp.]